MRENITPHQRALRAAAERDERRGNRVTPENVTRNEAGHQYKTQRGAENYAAKLDAAWGGEQHDGSVISLEVDVVATPEGLRYQVMAVTTRQKERGDATLKRDTNGRTIVGGDTVVWETEDGLSHHAGYVSERQDNDDIDVRVQPLGAAGDTYVVIKARRLRIAKQGNQGTYTVADLVDMADALEAPQPKAVVIPTLKEQIDNRWERFIGAGQSADDDLTVSEAPAPVSGPKFEVMSAAHHRNGVSGRGFYVGIVKHWGDLPEGEDPRLLQVIAVPEDDAPEDVSKITFENGSGAEIYVTDLMVIAKQGTVAFGRNSFRGDHFYSEARAIIIQTRADWDNQMLRLNR